MAVVNANLDLNSVAKVVNSPTPTSAGDVANKAYVDAAIEGLSWKDSVRVASTANVTVSSAPSTIDSITLAAGDRVLLKDQSSAPENGLYVFSASSSALTRSFDAQTGPDLEEAIVGVEEGTTNAGTTWRQTAVNFTIGSGSNTWAAFGTSVPDASTSTKGKVQLATSSDVASGSSTTLAITPSALAGASTTLHKVTATIGDNSATQFDVDISAINSAEVTYSVRDATSSQMIICDVKHQSATVLRFNFAAAPATNGVKVVVIG